MEMFLVKISDMATAKQLVTPSFLLVLYVETGSSSPCYLNSNSRLEFVSPVSLNVS